MAGKRQATSNLNHDNWDQEDEPEERGTFRTAPPEELKARVIKKATRRKAGTGASEADDAADTPGKSVFSGFSGFGKPAAATITGTPFAFLSNLPVASATLADSSPKLSGSGSTAKGNSGLKLPSKPFTADANLRNDLKIDSLPTSSSSIASRPSASTSTTTSIFGNSSATMTTKTPVVSMFKSSVPAENTTADNSITGSLEYRDNVAELNMAVMKFLQEHMDKNPYCVLTPVFDSYEKYMKKLRQKEDAKNNATTSLTKAPITETKTTAAEIAPLPSTPTFSVSATTTSSITAPIASTTSTSASVPSSSFFFGVPSSTTGTTDTTSPSSAFAKKPNCTVTSGGTTTTVTSPFYTLGSLQKSATLPSTTPTKSEATSSTASPSSIFGGFEFKPKAAAASPTATAVSSKEVSPKPKYTFGAQGGTAPIVSSEYVFGAQAGADPFTSPKANGFTFGSDKPTTTAFTGFGKANGGKQMQPPSGFFPFTSTASPISFGNVKPPSAADIANATKAEEEEEDKPPVVEFKQVVEEDAIFSKRCKVFVKKDKDFTDRGVGTLYLKPVKDSKKTQMLIRADTNLGNILINLILTDGLPAQRTGKNNVMMVCIPTPEETKAMSVLLRVKTAEEADDLLEQIKKHTV